MTDQVFINNLNGVLDGVALNIGQSTMTVDSAFAAELGAVNFSVEFILITLTEVGTEATWEIVKATGRVGQVVTIERAQEGTTEANWPDGSRVSVRVTEGSMDRTRRQVTRLLYDAEGKLLLGSGGEALLGGEV